jgi:hypothetical protein
MIITALSLDLVPIAANVHPSAANVAHQRSYIKTHLSAFLLQNPDFVRVDATEQPAPHVCQPWCPINHAKSNVIQFPVRA